MLLTTTYINDNVIDDGLYQLMQTDPSKVTRYATIVEKKIFSYVDKEQFREGEQYAYPEELQMIAITLLQNMYAFTIKSQAIAGVGAVKKYTERTDDYSETTERGGDGGSALSFFGIPIDRNSLDLLNSYKEVDEDFGMRGVELH